MATAPLMPKATAVWLVDNTALTFKQIAAFCQLHELEVKGIADGDVAMGIKGMDPITSGQLTRDELEKAQSRSRAISCAWLNPRSRSRWSSPRRGPVTRRCPGARTGPDAIDWLLRKHPELTDAQIIKLVGTTKPTIAAIREHTHWNSPNIQPRDPVTLGLCSQIDLDGAVRKAAERLDRERKKAEKEAAKLGTLAPAEETTQATASTATAEEIGAAMAAAVSLTPGASEEPEAAPEEETAPAAPDVEPTAEAVFGTTPEPTEEEAKEEEAPDPDSVFAKLAALKKELSDDEEQG